MSSGSPDQVTQSVRIAMVIALYWFVSISMVFLNKHLLSGVKLDAPLFVTWFQCVVAVVCCFFFGALRNIHPVMQMFPPFSIDLNIAKQVMPLSLVFVGMIAFNNLCLMYVGVAFYNVGRSLTTIFQVGFTYFFLSTTTSMRALMMCAVIVAGFLLGVDQEDSGGGVSYIGVFYGILASACVALNAIYIKKVLPLVQDDVWRLTAYNNANACLLFLPLIAYKGEFSALLSSPELVNMDYWVMMIFGGIFGIAIGIVTMLQIKFTSPLTHNISGTAKACAQTVLALYLSGESKTFMWWMSNFMVLGGSAGYTAVRHAEMTSGGPSALPIKMISSGGSKA